MIEKIQDSIYDKQTLLDLYCVNFCKWTAGARACLSLTFTAAHASRRPMFWQVLVVQRPRARRSYLVLRIFHLTSPPLSPLNSLKQIYGAAQRFTTVVQTTSRPNFQTQARYLSQ